MVYLNIKEPRTQKAKSVLFGCRKLHSSLHHSRFRGQPATSKGLTHLIQSHLDIKRLTPKFWENNPKVFARPCPLTPRHGFIDSRIISSNKELSNLLDEVIKIDPEGEVLLTRFIDKAIVNSVLTTSGLLSIGPGHDGATSGKSSFCLPVKPETISDFVLSCSGLPYNSNVFIEAVIAPEDSISNLFYLTQVRGGPAITATKDFIPKSIEVTKIVSPSDNLVAWEAEVKKFIPGIVVYAPGHTLASHAAIHCVINNVPFITSKEPKVGETLEPTEDGEPPLNLHQFKLGVTLGLSNSVKINHMLHVSATILHNWSFLRKSEHSSWLIGLASAYFVKVMCALNFGEYRHFTPEKKSTHRDAVYENVLKSNRIGFYMRKSPDVVARFTDPAYHKSGYGGRRWATATKVQLRIWNAIATIYEKGLDQKRINTLVSHFNKAVNLVHNNGWLFNKISCQEFLSDISDNPGFAALQLSDIIYDSYLKMQKIKHIRKIKIIKTEIKSNKEKK